MAARAMRRQATKVMTKQSTMGSMADAQHFSQLNPFEQEELRRQEMWPKDREKPRANLYNVIKRLRENAVSFARTSECSFL